MTDDDLSASLSPEDMDIDAFTNAVLTRLAEGDDEGIRALGDAVMAPLFVERYIDDIGPGNAWNDVLYHAVERLTALNAELAYLRPGLDAKQPFVARPNAPFRELVTIEQHDDGMQIQPRR